MNEIKWKSILRCNMRTSKAPLSYLGKVTSTATDNPPPVNTRLGSAERRREGRRVSQLCPDSFTSALFISSTGRARTRHKYVFFWEGAKGVWLMVFKS